MVFKNKIRLLTICLAILVGFCATMEEKKYSDGQSHGKLTGRVVSVKQGQLRGAILPRTDGNVYDSFKGIPYAHVPARFSAPEPPRPWEGIRDARKHGPMCPQYNLLVQKYIPGDENCLFLNVYTKSLSLQLKQAKTPVMVFIHGGSNMFGSGDADDAYGPEFLLQHDLVIVTINYRLEVLGFLSLDIPEVPGNNGMKDQVAALKWIKENIAAFGGDPDNITIYGVSSGSASVTQHLQSPMSKGLFHRAIAQSGVSIVEWAEGKNSKERAFRAVKFLGNDTTDTTKALEFLRSIPVEKLTNLTFVTRTEEEERRDLPEHFTTVVEKKFDNVEAFMSKEPIESLIAGKMNKVPLMVGYNSDEALIMLDDAFSKLSFTNKNLQYLVPREIAQRVTEDKTKELGERIRNFYVGNRDFTKDDAKAISDMLSDRHFVYNIHRFTNFYSKLSRTYLYKFSCDTELNAVKKDIGYTNMKGASHADDIFYIFFNDFNKDAYNNNPKLRDLVYRLTKTWADFAKYGDPTPSKHHNVNEVSWPAYTASNRSFLDFNEKFTVGQDTEKSRVDFWDKMYCDAGLPCISKSKSKMFI